MSFNEQCHTKGYGLTRVNVIQDSRLYTRVKVIQWLRSNNGQDHTQVKVIQGSIAYNSQGHTRVKVTIRF